jgi:hypothetical protein
VRVPNTQSLQEERALEGSRDMLPTASVRVMFDYLLRASNANMHLWSLWALSTVAQQLIHLHPVIQMYTKVILNRFANSTQAQTRVHAAEVLLALLIIRKGLSSNIRRSRSP